jgi:teichuronic acid biosynthesis glycosyltransferase TuaC
VRVLFVTSMYPSQEAPGYAAYMAEQVRSLRAAGVDVDLFQFNPRRTRFNYAVSLPPLIRKLRSQRYDVLHTHHTYSLILVDVARTVARSRVPLVLTNHEGEASDTTRRTRTWHPTSLLRNSLLLKKLVIRRADFPIFVSQRLSDVIYPSGESAVIPCGVDMEKFRRLDRAQCRGRLHLPLDTFVIFFPANPKSREKRIALAEATYDVVRHRHPRTLMLTGGNIPPESMPLYYNAADVVLQTSFYEGSPTIVKEALACEIPLVSTDVGDTQAVVRGVPHCFICRDDPSELADSVLKCEDQRATGGRDRLLALGLSLEQTARKLIGVYQRVANRPMGTMLSVGSCR